MKIGLIYVDGHNCPICRANYKRLNWMDKVLTPDPLPYRIAAF